MKRISTSSFLVSIFVLFLSSCSIISFEKITIECYPSERDAIINNEDSLRFTISPAPDRKTVERIFILELNDETIAGDFLWESNTFTFRPLQGWRWGERYTYGFEGEIKTEGDLEFSVIKTNTFYVEFNEPPLSITSFSPINENSTGVWDALTINFNKPVNPNSFLLEFNLTPGTDHTIEWIEDNTTVIITPKDRWDVNTRYKWGITRDLLAENGQRAEAAVSYYFTTNIDAICENEILLDLVLYDKDTMSYTLLNLDLDEVTADYQLLFRFPEFIEPESLENAYSIEPALSHQLIILSPTHAVIFPNETYTPGELYTIKIDETLSDISGNKLQDEISWQISCENIEFQEIIRITALNNFALFENGITSEPLPLHSPDGSEIYQMFTIYFSQPISDPDNQYQFVLNDLSIEGVFPISVTSPAIILINWINDTTLQVTYNEFAYSQDISANRINYYRFIIKGGTESTKTRSGSYLKEDFILNFSVGEDTP